jgi:hypothetical protein
MVEESNIWILISEHNMIQFADWSLTLNTYQAAVSIALRNEIIFEDKILVELLRTVYRILCNLICTISNSETNLCFIHVDERLTIGILDYSL